MLGGVFRSSISLVVIMVGPGRYDEVRETTQTLSNKYYLVVQMERSDSLSGH
jgi:hypothetical protein